MTSKTPTVGTVLEVARIQTAGCLTALTLVPFSGEAITVYAITPPQATQPASNPVARCDALLAQMQAAAPKPKRSRKAARVATLRRDMKREAK